jgi:subtilisin family serine protease
MRISRQRGTAALGAAVLVAAALTAGPASASGSRNGASSTTGEAGTFVVLAKDGASEVSLRAAIRKAGGTVTDVNSAIGMYTVTADGGFVEDVVGSAGVEGAAPNSVIGKAPKDTAAPAADVERLAAEKAKARAKGKAAEPGTAPVTGDTFSDLQWDMDMIHAPEANAYETGKGVRVGIMDTGVDASHPDIAPNFDYALSRNFTVDDPIIDGACADDPDGSCEDPADVDENGHGTHVAGTIAAARNGMGTVGIAPDADIVNLRAGQDSGYFFLKPTVDALTYAPTAGIDVVNMSYYIDPWQYNCPDNPADSPEAQQEQRTIIEATNRALTYARDHGVTLVAAAGNAHTDLDNPTFDGTSPDYPPEIEYDRTIDNSCKDMPAEGDGVVTVSSVGPTKLKAYYSNWGTEEITVAAPGGAYRDWIDGEMSISPSYLQLSTVPKSSIDPSLIDPETGEVDDPFVFSDCPSGPDSCGYYEYYQGTSMASPHVVGVVALIVGAHGHPTPQTGGLGLKPHQAEKILTRTATPTACPAPVFEYPGLPSSYASNCDGDAEFNGWYGNGIVDALAAVTGKH